MSVASSPEPAPAETVTAPSTPEHRCAGLVGAGLAEASRTHAPEIPSAAATDVSVLSPEMAHDAGTLICDIEELVEITVPSELGIAAAFADTSSLSAALTEMSSFAAAFAQQNAAMDSLISSVAEAALPLWSPPTLPSSVIQAAQAVQALKSSMYISVPKLPDLTAGFVLPTVIPSVLMDFMKPAQEMAASIWTASAAGLAIQQSLTVFGEMPRFTFLPDLTLVVNEMASLHNYAGLNAIQSVIKESLAHTEWVRHALGSVTSRIAEFVSVAGGYLLVAEAKAAYRAYERGDARPLKEFISKQLRFLDRLDDRCQALALALLTEDWKQSIDVSDEKAVRRALARAVREGNDLEGDHHARKRRIGYHQDRDLDLWVPGPEDLVINQVLPWHETFEDRRVRYTVKKLRPEEWEIARAWAENPPIRWSQAPELVGAEAPAGERVRRKVRRLGTEAGRREQLLREEA
ncbi:hypothetical protein ACIOMM_32350 [Streptomyces sp. NPDC087908]|uniref:hypothetical protein n=1 Tax=Streptomyces sp. NPDC087908 TaxID=3365820 RepID=UPI0037F59AC4